jgi:hypothetical protein
MSARDEILKAADDPSPPSNSIATLATPPQGSPPVRPRRAPTQPPPIPMKARSGELASGRPKQPSDLVPAIPSMIVREAGSSKVEIPAPPAADGSQPFTVPALPDGVIDLSANVPADTWMANPDTDLLSSHRMRGILTVVIAICVLAAIAVGVFFLLNRDGDDQVAVTPTRDAGVAKVVVDARPVEVDAFNTMSKEDILAISRFGYFTIDATAKTTIWVDNKLIGDTPLTRLPLQPGPHKIKAVGPRNKTKLINITIYGGKDTDEGTIEWEKEK